MIIELIELLETQIKDIERQVIEFIKKSGNVITTIPGIGDINRFNNSGQVLVFAGKLVRIIFYMLKRNVKFNLD